MSNGIKVALAFAVGAAVGVGASWKFFQTKYAKLADEEIASVKEVFSKMAREAKDEDEDEELDDSDIPTTEELESILSENSYTQYSKPERKEEQEDMNESYVIPPEEFGDKDDYVQISLTYYANGVLADDVDEVIYDIDDTVGREVLTHFGEYEDDSVFVRNDHLKIDYEILLSESNYDTEDK